ncbi:alpha/beta fold hydrolase [Corynebacterium sp. S7]
MTTSTALDSQDVQSGDYRLRVYTAGDPTAPAIIFLHGSGPGVSATSNWSELMPLLSSDYYCVAPDVLGFANSDHPDPAPAGMSAFTDLRARTIVEMMNTLGLEKAHFVGNSMGGMITLRLAQIAPERIDRILLMGTGGAPIPATDGLKRLITFYQNPTVENMKEMLPSFVANKDHFADRLDEIATDRTQFALRDDIRRSHLATFNPDYSPVNYSPEELGEITHDTLVVHGREDEIIPVEASYYMSTHLPNAELHVMPHAGHWTQIEQPQRFASLTRWFLAQDN